MNPLKAQLRQLRNERDDIVDFYNTLGEQVRAGQLTLREAQEIFVRQYGTVYETVITEKSTAIAALQAEVDSQRMRLPKHAIPISIVGILFIGLLAINFTFITGLFTASDETFYNYDLAQTYTESTTVPLTLNDPISSLRVNGEIEGDGEVMIWLQSNGARYLVTAFQATDSASPLTGLFIAEDGTEVSNETPSETPSETPEETPVETPTETVELTPTPEVPLEPVVEPETPAVQLTLDNACVETCALSETTTPYELVITVSGNTRVSITSITYGARDEPPQALETGEACTADAECTSNNCRASIFQGQATAKRCVPDNTYCVSATTVHAISNTLDDSTCYAAEGGSVWFVSEPTGRYEVRNRNGATLLVVDRYGNLGITGTAVFSTTPLNEGWLIVDNDEPALSVDAEGNLRTRGALSEQVQPTPSAGNDFVVKDTAGVLRAVLSSNGNVLLVGTLSNKVVFS
jgi:hypothetical protein